MPLRDTETENNLSIILKGYEHRTSNVQHRILNKVFCHFINWRSDPPASPELDPPASPEGEADGGQATKERRELSLSRDGGQERFQLWLN